MRISEIAVNVSREIGASIEDELEKSQEDEIRWKASEVVVAKAERNVKAISGQLKNEIATKGIDDKDSHLAKKYVGRCLTSVEELSEYCKTNAVVSKGKKEGLTAALAVVKKIYDRYQHENNVIDNIKAAIENGVVEIEDDSKEKVPKPPLKLRRIAEEELESEKLKESTVFLDNNAAKYGSHGFVLDVGKEPVEDQNAIAIEAIHNALSSKDE